METRHVKLNYDEALNAKKQLLSAELNILNIIKRLKNYKLLRKKEFTTKSKLKTATTSLKSKVNLIISTFPNESDEIITPKKIQRRIKPETQNLTQELEDIKAKLAKLK
tara:strand:- start:1962 stop:2288 length:327 start_codon:yes stop_codon:yes gene_type:complete